MTDARFMRRQHPSTRLNIAPDNILQHASLAVAGAPVLLSLIMAKNDFDRDLEDLCNPFSKAEICHDFSIVSNEFVEYYRRSPLVSTSFNFFGRALSMAASWLPTRTMSPEQFIGQTVLLFGAFKDLFTTVKVEVTAGKTPVSMREKRAFHAYFGPSGLAWTHFKRITSLAAEWVIVDEGAKIVSDSSSENNEEREYLYWLYKGEVKIQTNKNTYKLAKENEPRLSDIENPCRMGLWGQLDPELLGLPTLSVTPREILSVGEGGATLLRIHVPSLAGLMKTDNDLSEAVKLLFYKSMEDKAITMLMGED